jgi:hypothetical protein
MQYVVKLHPSNCQLVFLAALSTSLRLLFRKTPTVYSENYTYTDSVLFGQKSELFTIKTGGTYSYHYDVQGSSDARAPSSDRLNLGRVSPLLPLLSVFSVNRTAILSYVSVQKMVSLVA